jgi:hypothetical protein
MTARALVLFAALFLEDNDLLIFAVRHDGGGNLAIARPGAEQRLELDRAAGIGRNGGHANSLAFRDQELFSTGFDNCV